VRNISFAARTRLCLGQIWDELSVQQFSLSNAGGVSRSFAVALFSWMLEVDLIGKGSLTDLNGFVTASACARRGEGRSLSKAARKRDSSIPILTRFGYPPRSPLLSGKLRRGQAGERKLVERGDFPVSPFTGLEPRIKAQCLDGFSVFPIETIGHELFVRRCNRHDFS
jgi:hypothetical protein